MEACEVYVNNETIVTVEDSMFNNFMINFYRFGCDLRTFYFVMNKEEFNYINYAHAKLLQAGSQITQLHNSISQYINK